MDNTPENTEAAPSLPAPPARGIVMRPGIGLSDSYGKKYNRHHDGSLRLDAAYCAAAAHES